MQKGLNNNNAKWFEQQKHKRTQIVAMQKDLNTNARGAINCWTTTKEDLRSNITRKFKQQHKRSYLLLSNNIRWWMHGMVVHIVRDAHDFYSVPLLWTPMGKTKA